jgi:hypothetical protein
MRCKAPGVRLMAQVAYFDAVSAYSSSIRCVGSYLFFSDSVN